MNEMWSRSPESDHRLRSLTNRSRADLAITHAFPVRCRLADKSRWKKVEFDIFTAIEERKLTIVSPSGLMIYGSGGDKGHLSGGHDCL